MHILITHRYYWPDAPAYALMLRTMAERFIEDGHQVTVLTTQPGYNNIYQGEKLPVRESSGGIDVIRMNLLPESKKSSLVRALNVAIYCLRLFFHLLFHPRRYGLVTVASFPPTVAALAVRLGCLITRTPYLYHCQDLYPEVAIASGLMTNSFMSRLVSSIDTGNCRHASAVVVLSGDMLRTLRKRGVDHDRVHIINNFIIDRLNLKTTLPDALRCPQGKFRVLFAGNLGRFQSLDKVVQAGLLLRDESDIQLMFVGAGAMREQLATQAGAARGQSILFVDHQPLERVLRIIHESPLSLISLAPGVVYTAYPSKTMSYLEGGARVLAIVEEESELADFVLCADVGTVCGSTEPQRIAEAIVVERNRWRQQGHDPARVRQIADQHFSQEQILRQWSELLKSLGDLR